MANYTNLKSTINAQIRQNGTGAITGPVLNGVLRDMVSALGEAGYLYKGVATPATSPGTPDSNVFYIASTAGTYTNFGGAVVADGEVAILKYNGTWTKEVTGAATAAQVTQLGQDVEDVSDGLTAEGLARVMQLGGNVENFLDWRNLSVNTNAAGNHPFASETYMSTRLASYAPLVLPVGTKIKVSTETGYWAAVAQFNDGYPANQAPINSSWLPQTGETEITVSRPNLHFTIAKGASRTDAITPAEGVNINIYVPGLQDTMVTKTELADAIKDDYAPVLFTGGYVDCDNNLQKFHVYQQIIVKHGGNSYNIAAGTELAYASIASAYTALVYDTSTSSLKHIAHSSINYKTQAVILSLVRDGSNYYRGVSTIASASGNVSQYEYNKFSSHNGMFGEIIADNIRKTITINLTTDSRLTSTYMWSNYVSKTLGLSQSFDFSAMGGVALLCVNYAEGTLSLVNTYNGVNRIVLAVIRLLRTGDDSNVVKVISPGFDHHIIKPYRIPYAELTYEGPKISLRNSIRKFLMYDFGTLTTGGNQGFLAYGDYSLFYGVIGGSTEQADPAEKAKINLFAISTKTKVADLELNVGGVTCPWGNTICWGRKYDESDPLPLLYISQTRQVSEQGCLVYRLTESGGTWTATLVQTIMSSGSFLGTGFGDWVVDVDAGFIYSVRNMTTSFLGKTWKINKFPLPALSDSSVTLAQSDVVDSWEQTSQGDYLPCSTKMIHAGRLFLCGGHDAWPSTSYLYVIDLNTHTLLNAVDINGSGGEPQGTCVYEGLMLWVYGNVAKVFAMDFN